MMILRSSLRPRTPHLILASLASFCGIQELSAAPPSTTTSLSASLSRSPSSPFSATMDQAGEPRYPWKKNIVGTVFWVGELPTQNNPTPNTASSWDPKWMHTFGGYDDPDIKARSSGYRPANFVPKQNPFYIALPYNDVMSYKDTKDEASKIIPWYKDSFVREGKSVCHNRWIAIRYKDKTCYAQWSDCGPFVTTDASYVFGDARPINTKNKGAGIDLAPAVRDYLGFTSGHACDWRFVDENEVPDGPWKDFGSNNPFSLAGQKSASSIPSYAAAKARTSSSAKVASSESERIEELRRQRDLWFNQNGAKNSSR